MTSLHWFASATIACSLAAGCSDDAVPGGDTDAAGGSSGNTSGAPSSTDPTDDSESDSDAAPTTDGSTSDDPTMTTLDPTDAASSSTTDGPSSDTDDPSHGEPAELPTPDGACPEFANGTLTFSPGEIESRDARVWFDPSAGGGGPLVFYWHGTGSNPEEAVFGLGQAAIDDIMSRGGMVVAAVHDPNAGQFPWYLVTSNQEDDLHLMDEIVGCAAAGPGIDPARIHAIGMSAGGLHTSQASIRRASYIASVVAYSGGLAVGEPPEPERAVDALIYHGGQDDVVVIPFAPAAVAYESYLDERGGYTLICDHGGGHVIPDARVHSWSFMLDHPFDIAPKPYANGVPQWVPDYCVE